MSWTGTGTAITPSTNLTTVSAVKTYLSITSSDDDALLTPLVTAASNMIKKEVGTDIVATTYNNEIYDGYGQQFLYLDHFPLIDVKKVNIDRYDAVEIKNTIAPLSTVQVTSDSVILREAVNGAWSDTVLDFTDYPVISDISAHVETLTNWTSTYTNAFSNYPSSELIVVPARDSSKTYAKLEVPYYPEHNYEIESVPNSVLYKSYGWDKGIANIIVTYRAGWETIPEDLVDATKELVKILYYLLKEKNAGDFDREKIGDYEYERGEVSLAIFDLKTKNKVANLINTKVTPYRRVLVW